MANLHSDPPNWGNPYYAHVRSDDQTTNAYTLVDPYVVETLKNVVGKMIVVNTGDSTVRGRLKNVKPDHIVLHDPEGHSTLFVRIQKIVWIMPD